MKTPFLADICMVPPQSKP